MPKKLLATRTLVVPEGVKITIKSLQVEVEGPRGKMSMNMRKFGRMVDMKVIKNGTRVKVDIWHATRKEVACLRSLAAKVENMMIGVTVGFLYKMRFVYNHFPINSEITEGGRKLIIKNFIGERRNREILAAEGVKIVKSKDVKDEITVEGNDVDKVSLFCAQVYGCTRTRNKDIRKFLDGIYISERTNVVIPE